MKATDRARTELKTALRHSRGTHSWAVDGAPKGDSGKPGDPGTDSKKPDSDPGAEGKHDGADAARDAAVTAAALTAHAQRRHKEIVGAELGRLRKAGLDLPRDATLKDLAELALSLKATSDELKTATEQTDDGDEPPKGKKESASKESSQTVPRSEVNRIVKSKLEEQAKLFQTKLDDKDKELNALQYRLKLHVVVGEVRKLAETEGMHPDGVVDFIFNPMREYGFDIEPGEKPGQFRVLDKSDGSEAINPTTRDVYKLPELIRELKARKDLAHLVIGKLAGGGGGGGAKSGADRADTSRNTTSDRPMTSLDFLNRGIKSGLLEKGSS